MKLKIIQPSTPLRGHCTKKDGYTPLSAPSLSILTDEQENIYDSTMKAQLEKDL